jgi:hypothetical protein
MNRTVYQLIDDILERLSTMPGTPVEADCITDEYLKREED